MNFLFLILINTISAHSGNTDTHGCHAGSQPYHCHNLNSSEIIFDTLHIEGQMIKPSLNTFDEIERSDPCSDIDPTKDEYVECQLNLSFREINKICKDLVSGDSNIEPFLEYLIDLSGRQPIVETTIDGNWIYKRQGESFLIESSPKGTYDGKVVSNLKAIQSISALEKNQIFSELKMDSHNFYDDKEHAYQIWESCLTSGENYLYPQIVFRTAIEENQYLDAQEVPAPLSSCDITSGVPTIDPKITTDTCISGWDWKNMVMPGTRFNLDQDYHDVNYSLYNDRLAFENRRLISKNNDAIKYYPISNSMIIVKNYDRITNNSTYGILYRKVAASEYEDFINEKLIRLTLDRKAREEFIKLFKEEYVKQNLYTEEREKNIFKTKTRKTIPKGSIIKVALPTIAVFSAAIIVPFMNGKNFHSVAPLCWSTFDGDNYRYECL